MTNLVAPAVTAQDIQAVADRLGCSVKQVNAVAKVESAGGGFDNKGRPKILFERHYFHRLTDGKWSVSRFSNPSPGGYSEDSWSKLLDAAAKDPWAAFQAASWGKFQVMGAHWETLGYESPWEMAWAMRQSEAGHYDALARYVEAFGLAGAMRQISTNPETCRAFAKGYNGPGYLTYSYHTKLAKAML